MNAADEVGFRTHHHESKFQGKPTVLRVLPPDKLEAGKKYRVVYVLPVEPGVQNRFGDGLLEVKKLDLHNKLGVFFVMPAFSDWPWYADHPTDAGKRQESYFLKDVLPFIEKTYPVRAERKGRLLLGFSKSGWGAFALLLRHPELFERAAAFDAPLNLTAPGKFGSGAILADQKNFDRYRLDRLLGKQGKKLGADKRLAFTGHANFRADHEAIHKLMQQLGVPHLYLDERKPRHHWNADWIELSVRFLVD